VFRAACPGALRDGAPCTVSAGPREATAGQVTFDASAGAVHLHVEKAALDLQAAEVAPGRLVGPAVELRREAGDPGRWAGVYVRDDGEPAMVGEFHEFGAGAFFIDYGSGVAGPIFEDAPARASILATLGATAFPARGEVRIPDEGGLEASVGGVTRRWTRLPVVRRTFTVVRDGVALRREVVAPSSRAPRGVVVIVHGSGDGPRRAYDPWVDFIVARGWAVAVSDKRGSGASQGDWHTATLDVLADDLAAVAESVRAMPDLARSPLGLWGISQGGWIAPLVAERVHPDFVMLWAGAATSTTTFVGETVAAELRAYGMPQAQIDEATAYYQLDQDVTRGARPFADLEAAYRRETAAGVEWILEPPPPPDAPDRTFMRHILGFSPERHWARIVCPVLAVFGEKDLIVPFEPNAKLLESFLPAAVPRRIVVRPDGNHLGLLAKMGVRAEYPRLGIFDVQYFREMATWLDAHERRAVP
jgi:alpha-beta hydrolase superfamily lysophospholipase